MGITPDSLWYDISLIRKKAPLVQNITNYVVMNNTANALLALGASPIMAHAIEEIPDMLKICNALVVNIGTLDTPWIESMKKAVEIADIPVVLDPVGAGATPLRTNTVHSLLKISSPTIIRGNASEIKSCVSDDVKTKGVDSIDSSDNALDAAKQLNKSYGSCIVISGETDYIVSSDKISGISNGHEMMTKVTGLGCSASSLCGAFIAVNEDAHLASAHAMATMGIAAQIAAQKAEGPGTLQLHFLDALHNLDKETVEKYLKVKEIKW